MNDLITKFNILNKAFLTLKDIAIIMECSREKARKYRTNYITKRKLNSDFFQVNISTQDFLEFYEVDVSMIRDNYILLSNNGVINYEKRQD